MLNDPFTYFITQSFRTFHTYSRSHAPPAFVLSKFNRQDDPRPEFNSVQRKQDSSCLFRRLSRVLSLMPVAQIAASKRRINTYTRLLFMTRDQQ